MLTARPTEADASKRWDFAGATQDVNIPFMKIEPSAAFSRPLIFLGHRSWFGPLQPSSRWPVPSLLTVTSADKVGGAEQIYDRSTRTII